MAVIAHTASCRQTERKHSTSTCLRADSQWCKNGDWSNLKRTVQLRCTLSALLDIADLDANYSMKEAEYTTDEVMAALEPYLEDGRIALDGSSSHVKVYNRCTTSC